MERTKRPADVVAEARQENIKAFTTGAEYHGTRAVEAIHAGNTFAAVIQAKKAANHGLWVLAIRSIMEAR